MNTKVKNVIPGGVMILLTLLKSEESQGMPDPETGRFMPVDEETLREAFESGGNHRRTSFERCSDSFVNQGMLERCNTTEKNVYTFRLNAPGRNEAQKQSQVHKLPETTESKIEESRPESEIGDLTPAMAS